MSQHTLTIHDTITSTDRRVSIDIQHHGDEWRFVAHFEGQGEVLASGQNLWFTREEDVLALAHERVREAMRKRDPRAFF